MNPNTYQYWIEESLDYLVYLDSLKCFSGDFKKDTIGKAISDIFSKRELKEVLDKHSISQQTQEQAIDEACKNILNNIWKWDLDSDVNDFATYISNDELLRNEMNKKILSYDIEWMTLDEFTTSHPEHKRFIKCVQADFGLDPNEHRWIPRGDITIKNIIEFYTWLGMVKVPGMWRIILGRMLKFLDDNNIKHNITNYK